MVNSFPTELNPWYSVFRVGKQDMDRGAEIEYFSSTPINEDEKYEPWTEDKKEAQIFLSFRSATAIALAEAAEVMMIWRKDQLTEWGRG